MSLLYREPDVRFLFLNSFLKRSTSMCPKLLPKTSENSLEIMSFSFKVFIKPLMLFACRKTFFCNRFILLSFILITCLSFFSSGQTEWCCFSQDNSLLSFVNISELSSTQLELKGAVVLQTWVWTNVVLISLFSQFSVEKILGTASFFNIFFFKPGVEYEAWRKSLLRKCRPHNTAVLEGVQLCLPTAATHFNKRFLFLWGNLCKQCENLLQKDLCI